MYNIIAAKLKRNMSASYIHITMNSAAKYEIKLFYEQNMSSKNIMAK